MKIFKIALNSWTASFRYPNIISGSQPTLRVPPLSTIFGLISAAKGDRFEPKPNMRLAYYFDYESTAFDLETIYCWKSDFKIDKKSNKTKCDWKQEKMNIVHREQMFDCRLIIYVDDENIAQYFKVPIFQLLLGRSTDLASVMIVEELDISEKESLNNVIGTIIPFKKHKIASTIHSLPVLFSDDIPRKTTQADTFYLLDAKNKKSFALNARGFHDKNLMNKSTNRSVDLYWQEVIFKQ